MHIYQIYTNNALRNFTYIIELDNKKAIAIDPWDDQLVNDFLNKHSLFLTTIINTHEHWDHIQGNEKLVQQHKCEVWAHSNGVGKIPGLSRMLTAHQIIKIQDNVTIEVLDTPGHCQAHLCFIVRIDKVPTYIFTGDILFNAGVGNCHDGSVNDMFTTIQEQIITLPDNITIFPGHDYLENNLNFTLYLEPSNKIAQQWLIKYQQSDINIKPLTTTLADERQVNTFFRLENIEILNNLPSKPQNNKETFVAIRSLRNNWQGINSRF